MKYLCLVYTDRDLGAAVSRAEWETLAAASLAYDEQLQHSGHYVIAQALQAVETAVTVRVRNNKLSTTDGPFAETREQLGGFILIEARDLNDAIQVAAQIPMVKLGCIEVRPVLELRQP